jgi:type III secretion protein L
MDAFVFLNGAELRIAPGTKVVKAEAYSRFAEAGELLESAHARAGEIASRAEAAYREEKARGFAEGVREGRSSLARILLETASRSARHLEDNEGRIIAIVSAALRKILGEAGEKERIAAVVRSALSVVSRQDQVTVRVPAGQEQTVREAVHRMLQAHPRIRSLEVVADPELTGTRCVLETKVGKVEASLESQLQAVTEALEGLRAGRAEDLQRELKTLERGLLESLKEAT